MSQSERPAGNGALSKAVDGTTPSVAPAVLAEPHDRATWRVLCPFCACWHHHGRGPDGDLTGPRVAHCGASAGRQYRLVSRREVPRARR